MSAADDAARTLRLRQIEERRKLAEVAGVQIPVMPPRLPGESDRDYCIRLARIAKSHCGPPPKPKTPPRRLSTGKAGKADKSIYQPSDQAELGRSPEVSANAQFVKPNVVDSDRLVNFPDEPPDPEDY